MKENLEELSRKLIKIELLNLNQIKKRSKTIGTVNYELTMLIILHG